MQKNGSFLGGLVVLVMLFGCGSMQKNAAEKLENGEYDSASSLYERILKNDPSNLEAQEGLKRARGGMLGNRLIDVRKSRDSGRADEALEILLGVVTLEGQWNVYPPAAARFTQEEETNFAWKPFRVRIDTLLQAKQPLAADFAWTKYQPIFSGSKHAPELQSMRPTIARVGRDHCSALSRDASVRAPFYVDFVGRYCRYWKAPLKATSGVESARTAELISGFAWKGKVENLPSEYDGIFRKDFEEALKGSAWYDPAGKQKITLEMNGKYAFSHTKNLVSRVHEYEASESYQAVEDVKKIRIVPKQVQRLRVDPVDGKSKLVSEIVNTEESYTEQQVVQRSRPVKRQFPYSALYHQQEIALDESVVAQINQQNITLAESARAKAEGDEQNITQAEVGLRPTQPKLLDPPGWIGGESQKLKSQLAQKLRDEWLAQVCTAPGESSPSVLGNRVQKCKRDSAGATSAFVNDWYVKTFGINQAEAESLLASAGSTKR